MNVMSSVLWLAVVRDCYLLVAIIAGGAWISRVESLMKDALGEICRCVPHKISEIHIQVSVVGVDTMVPIP